MVMPRKVFIEVDTLGIGKTKTIGYLTQIHPCIVNQTSTKDKLYNNLNTTIINPKEAAKTRHNPPRTSQCHARYWQ